MMSTLSENYPNEIRRLGVLSQTLAPSPQVRWILPARIRSRQHHDVVFVGESCIQLREFLPNGQLADATAKLNIGAQIMAAKVISAKVEKIPTIDAVLDQEWDEERFLIKGMPCNDDQPPQLVVLCTAAGELVYVYAKPAMDTGVRLVFAKRTILHGISMLSKYGRHMAIDQESRLLAVASADACAVFSLKDVDDLKESIDSWQPRQPTSFQPNKEQRFLPIDGTIVRMEFLRSPADELVKVYLLLMVAKAGETRLLLYRWDSRESLVTMEPMRCSGYTLPQYDSFPLLLVTAARPLSFWIVTETELAIYENLRSPNVKRTSTRLAGGTTSNEQGLWVQWAKPSRHEKYLKEREDILLMREDGATRVFSRTHSPPSNSMQSVSPGELNMRIDTAVCMLPGPRYMGGDILIVGGVGSDGGVFHLTPRKYPILLQTIPNVSPIYDMVILDDMSGSTTHKDTSDRTFVLSDGTNGPKLHELRLGLEGQVGWTMPLEQCATIDRLWALELRETKTLYFLASHPDRTAAIEFNIENQDDLSALEPETCYGFNLRAPTLAATALSSGNIAQITSDGINVVTSSVRTSEPSVTSPLYSCVCADIEPMSGVFVTASAASVGYEIRAGVIGDSRRNPQILLAPVPHNVSGRPQILKILQHIQFHILAVGYFDGSIQIFTIHPEHGLQEQTTFQGSGTKGAGVSGISLLVRNTCSHVLALVGSIDGVLQIHQIQLDLNKGKPISSFEPLANYKLGTTAVSLASADRDIHESASTLITCGSRMCHLSCLSSGPLPDFVLNDVWITSRGNISFEQPRINATHRVPILSSNAGAEPSGIVMCATDEEILFTSLLDQEQMVPRCLSQHEGARHLVHSRYLNKFVLAADGQKEPPRKAMLHLVDPDSATIQDTSSTSVACGEANEKIKALISWNPSDGKRHYELFMVALSDGRNSRVGHLTAKKLSSDQSSQGDFKTVLRFAGKETHSLCAFGMSSAIISVGNQLTLLHLDMATKKFLQLATYDLPSPALSVSSRGSHIYAATTKHSMMVLQVEANTFKRVFADRGAKNARNVVPFGQNARHVVLSTVSDNGTCISGYVEGGSGGDHPTPSFEAQVSLPIDCLAPVRTSWTHDQQYGLQGTTLDGTIYLFKTLTYDEWKLLRFLEKLAQPDINKPAKRMSLLTKKMARTWVSSMEQEEVSTFDPKSMHVRGDVLQRLIEEGPYDLRRLLGVEVKGQDEMAVDSDHTRYTKFESVAVPVIGQNEHLVLAVVRWIRKLLRSSVF